MFLTEERVQTELNKSIRRSGVPLNESMGMTAQEDKDFAYMIECFVQAEKETPLSESVSFEKKNAILMLSKGKTTVIFGKNTSKFEALVLEDGKPGDRQKFKNSLDMDEYVHELQSNGFKIQKKDDMVKLVKKYAFKIGKVILKIGLISVIAVVLFVFLKWIIAFGVLGGGGAALGAVTMKTMALLGVVDIVATMVPFIAGWSVLVVVKNAVVGDKKKDAKKK
jgi:hypothetical protein